MRFSSNLGIFGDIWYLAPISIGQDLPMRLDHVSYVTSHDQLADTVQRLGSRLGSTFVDGGVYPRFGTRNFTLPLQNGHYIEVVCPLDHPASDASPFGKAVSKRAAEGGGWLTWVVSVDTHPERDEIYKSQKTIIMREYSRSCCEGDEPYYPVNSIADRSKLSEYRKLAASTPNTFFAGRLGSYQYLNMHMAIASALSLLKNQLIPLFR